MRELNIAIEKGRIASFTVTLVDEGKEIAVAAVIDLLTPNGEAITSYRIDSNAWDDKKKFNLPLTMIASIKAMLTELEYIVVTHCEDRNKMLAEGSDVKSTTL